MATIDRKQIVEPVPSERAVNAINFDRVSSGRVCILGIGNRERGDDAAGSLLAESLDGKTRAIVIDAGAVPENYLGKVLRAAPDTILVVDAIDFGAAPGTTAEVDRARLGAVGLSTHALSLGMAVNYLSEQSNAQVVVIGIQPGRLEYGVPVSAAVARGLASLHEQLLGLLGPEPQETQHEDR